jgi:hypothetical protein
VSLNSEIAAGFTEAQGLIAEATGMPVGAPGNFTLFGANYTGVLNEINSMMQGTGTGYESIRELHIIMTRTQVAAKPDAAGRPPVVALGKTWLLTAVGESAAHYFLTCRPT